MNKHKKELINIFQTLYPYTGYLWELIQFAIIDDGHEKMMFKLFKEGISEELFKILYTELCGRYYGYYNYHNDRNEYNEHKTTYILKELIE